METFDSSGDPKSESPNPRGGLDMNPEPVISLNMPMNDRKAMEALMAKLGVVVKREQKHRPKQHIDGFWLSYAWMVRAIMENYLTEPSMKSGKKLMVSKVARVVMRRAGIPVTHEKMECLRVVYYKVRKKPWPRGMKEMLGIASTVTEEEIDFEDFEEELEAELDTTPVVIPVDDLADAESYLDDELRAEILAEEEERRLISQIALSRGVDPDADEGFNPEE